MHDQVVMCFVLAKLKNSTQEETEERWSYDKRESDQMSFKIYPHSITRKGCQKSSNLIQTSLQGCQDEGHKSKLGKETFQGKDSSKKKCLF